MRITQKTVMYLTMAFGISVATQGGAMGFFDRFKICLYSEMQGVVTLHGQPVAGAQLVRKATYAAGKTASDSTATDAQGRFHFAPMYVHMFPRFWSFGGDRVGQIFSILHNGKELLGWRLMKYGYNENSEFNPEGSDMALKMDLICELTDDPDTERPKGQYFGTVYKGICRLK
jgi:hypothetical protein